MTGHIFLSYRSLEVDFALRLATDLKNAGVRVWMDRLELKPADDWRRGIETGLNQSEAMICVMSPDYATSEYCRRELATIDDFNLSEKNTDKKRPVFPVFIRPVPEPQKPIEIRRLQYIYFYDEKPAWVDWRDSQLYNQRLQQLLDLIKLKAGRQVEDVPDPETIYLNTLIADLTRRGVLEYVELRAEADIRPQPPAEDEWGYTELIDHPLTSEKIHRIREVVEKHARFALIGEPGAGKTTIIRRLAREAAHQRKEKPRTAPLPLFLYLPQWSRDTTPQEFIRSKWTLSGDPIELLKTGDIFLYLDGLNEMGAKGPQKARLLRDWLESANAPARVIVTCRVGDYTGDLKLGDLPTVVTQALDAAQIREFAGNYLEEKAAPFLSHILPEEENPEHETRSLLQLAHNPYMLGALTFIYENSPDRELPRNPGRLFQRLVRALWKREEQRHTLLDLSFEEVESAFARLAFAMIDEDQPIDVPYDYALAKVGNARFIQVGLNASFILQNQDNIRFYHQVMQEYLAASHLLKTSGDDLVERVLSLNRKSWDQWVLDTSREKITTISKWDHVVLCLVGIISDTESLLLQMAEEDPVLPIRCLISAPNLSKESQEKVLNEVIKIIVHDFNNTRGMDLLVVIDTLLVCAEEAGLEELVQINLKNIIAEYVNNRLDEPIKTNVDQWLIAMKAMLSDFKTTLSLLNNLAPQFIVDLAKNENPFARKLAIETLNHTTHSELFQQTLNDPYGFVRIAAISQLGKQGPAFSTPLITKLADKESIFRPMAARLEREFNFDKFLEVFPRDIRVCDYAAMALEKIGTPEALAAVEKWRKEDAGSVSEPRKTATPRIIMSQASRYLKEFSARKNDTEEDKK